MKMYVKRWGINGEGIAYDKKTPVFIEGAIPGELAEVKITARNPKYSQGVAEEILEESPRRRHPICDKWQECGGCALMHVDYKGQVRMKEHVLKEALKKYAGYTGPIAPMMKNPSPLAYRNAIKMPFGMKAEDGKEEIITGMYKKGSSTFVPIERCIVHSRNLEKARQEVTSLLNQYQMKAWNPETKSGLISLVAKEYDDKVHVVLVTSPDVLLPEQLIEDLMNLEPVASVWQSKKEQNDGPDGEIFGDQIEHLAGETEMDLHLKDLTLKLLPRSFFQLNTEQAKNLYQKVIDLIPEQTGLLVEAYSGIGVMSLMAADKAKEVIGIENIMDAVANAQENARLNGKTNVTFLCGDAAEQMHVLVEDEHIDTLLVDPPRSGMSKEMIDEILKARPVNLIYVSCNPATLAKDISRLQEDYEIKLVQPVDMFSQTPHIETIVLLKKISTSRKVLGKPGPHKTMEKKNGRPGKYQKTGNIQKKGNNRKHFPDSEKNGSSH